MARGYDRPDSNVLSLIAPNFAREMGYLPLYTFDPNSVGVLVIGDKKKLRKMNVPREDSEIFHKRLVVVDAISKLEWESYYRAWYGSNIGATPVREFPLRK